MELDHERLAREASAFLERPGENVIDAETALSPDMAGLCIFDAPLFGFSSAADPLYAGLKRPEAVGPWFMEPPEWLEGAKTVVSFFLPFTEAVKKSNARHPSQPSNGWLHARIEGQAILTQLGRHLKAVLEGRGWRAHQPFSADTRRVPHQLWNTDSAHQRTAGP